MANDTSISLDFSLTKAKLDADIVTGTLDKLNSGDCGSSKGTGDAMKQTYDFSKEILSAVYGGKGSIANGSG